MKNLNKILVVVVLVMMSLAMFSMNVEAASTGPASCSVTPASGSIAQGGELSFVVSSNVPSSSSDYVYVSATNFSDGLYSDFGPGKVIPVGSSSVNFKVYAQSLAEVGSQTFKVNCSTGCPVGGCPGGGSPDILGTATVSLTVTGTASGGGGTSGTGQCSVPDVSLPPNSSTVLKFELPPDSSSIVNGSIGISGTSSNPNISVSPLFSNIRISGGRRSGNSDVLVKTGPNFSGGSYTVTSDISGAKCTAIGNITLPVVNNPSGKVKLTRVEALNPIIFPESGCVEAGMYGTGSGADCRYGFGGSVGSGPKILNYTGSAPLLFGGDLMRSTYSRITPTSFSLTDPMNPKIASRGVITYSYEDIAPGEHGATAPVLVAQSKDGSYSVVKTNYDLLAFKSPHKDKVVVHNFIGGSSNLDIVKANSSYVLLYDTGAKNITNIENMEAPLPSSFPNFNSYEFMGVKMLLGDGSYVAVSANGPTGHVNVNDVLLFSVNQSEPLAKLTIPSGQKKINFSQAVRVPSSDGDYIFSLANGAVNLFKFDLSKKEITWIIKNDEALYSDYIKNYKVSNMTGFDLGNGNNGIISFNSKGLSAFLFSDIISGKWIDTFVNSPKPGVNHLGNVMIENGPRDFFSLNGITYVYSSNSDRSVKVWKLESNTGGGSSTPVGGGGGAPFYPTPETQTEVAGCPGGTVYQTSAGALCVNSSGGVTTMTSFNFDKTVIQSGCFGWNMYSTSTGEKCLSVGSSSKTTEFMGPPTYDLGDFILKKGSKGEKVKELQRLLNNDLNLSLVVDGKMGPNTVSAVKQWQNSNGLVSDGIVGPKTREAMNSSF